MSDHYTSNLFYKPYELPRLPPSTESTHITSRAHLENTLKITSTKTSVPIWKCVLCDITLPAPCRDAHEISTRHNASMKRQKRMSTQLAHLGAKGEEVDGQTSPVHPKELKKKKKKKKEKEKEKNRTENAENAGAQTPASVNPLSIPPEELPKPRQPTPTKGGREKRDRTARYKSRVSTQAKLRNVMNPPVGTVERTVVNGAPVIRIISAMPVPARIAVPKIEHPPVERSCEHPPVERSWMTWYAERQERYGYVYSFKQKWWKCPECKWTMYEACKGAHELKKCKPPAPWLRKAGVMPVGASRVKNKSEHKERAAQKEHCLSRAGARDTKYKYMSLFPSQILSTPGVQIEVWSSMQEMGWRKETEIMGKGMKGREGKARKAVGRKDRAKKRRENERNDRGGREREMRAQQMREEEIKLQGRNGKSSRWNTSRGG